MSVTCWTIVHQAAASATRGVGHITHAAKHIGKHVLPRRMHHAATILRPSRSWVEVVCKVAPAALAGGGLLVPTPASPPIRIEPPPAFLEPAPVVASWFEEPVGSDAGSVLTPYTSSPAVTSAVPEPGSAFVLLAGTGGLLLVRHLAAASQARARRSCCGADQSIEPS